MNRVLIECEQFFVENMDEYRKSFRLSCSRHMLPLLSLVMCFSTRISTSSDAFLLKNSGMELRACKSPLCTKNFLESGSRPVVNLISFEERALERSVSRWNR
jgi:hypothetical protein